jgi:hypothetical protein
MILAGDVPMNSVVQCMASVSSIADGALKLKCYERQKNLELAILVGWKKINDERVEEEVEKVQEIIGAETVMTGFLWEMAPFNGYTSCELHNQTMTLTLSE